MGYFLSAVSGLRTAFQAVIGPTPEEEALCLAFYSKHFIITTFPFDLVSKYSTLLPS